MKIISIILLLTWCSFAYAQTKAKLYLIHTESGIKIPTTNSSSIGGVTLTSSSTKSKTVFNVFANGNKICKGIQNNKYKIYDIAPGTHEFSVKMGLLEKKPDVLKLAVEANKDYYILMNLESKLFKDVFTFTQINYDDFSGMSDMLVKAKKGC